jgi:hypothetical protein
MRLNATEKAGILQTLGGLGALYLCGSRVDDSLAGGDIDLLLLANNPEHRAGLMAKKHHLLSALKATIGDQRIDLTIATLDRVQSDPVLQSIYQRAIRLN